MQQSVIILGHGSKSKDAIEDFNYVVESTKVKSGIEQVYGAHMELAEPSLENVVSELYSSGQTKLVILPYFLFNGNHIKEDIPTIIKRLEEKYRGLEIVFGSPIGKEPMMADIMMKKVQELAS
ncbi:MAG: CbiX/SirB N-terminal domain-containing protein [Salinivirgaceae bacterium]|jgi:sirohydrochlorin cobaltochelatase|nr:CbiX/SirB N-terminal domain-containing protein [Salinivirgaceae bacterium]